MSLMSWIFFCLVLFLPNVVRGTLTPSGTVAVDCGGQLTFTCNVTGITTNSQAGWTIMGLVNITASGSNGLATANTNPRITGTGGNVPISTITIADFTMSDNGGTVQCINTDDISDQGTATISVGIPSCPSNMVVYAGADVVAVTWQQPPNTPPVSSTTVTYCPTSSPNCTNSTDCTTNPCIISGLGPGTMYNFTIAQANNCGSVRGCTGDNSTAETTCFCSVCTTEPTSILPTSLAGTIPSAVLILVNIISVLVAVLTTRCCCNGTSQKSSSKLGDANDHIERPKTYEDITMTDSPAYGPVK